MNDDFDIDEAADTMRFVRIDPDATSIYDLSATPRYTGRSDSGRIRRRLIRETRQSIVGLRAALVSGWAIGPELVYEERRLAAMEAA